MEEFNEFTDEDAHAFLASEWRSKYDAGSRASYYFKVKVDKPRDRICFIITDTKSVWFEGLDYKHFTRRWHKLNPASDTDTGAKNPTTTLRALHIPPKLTLSIFSISKHPDVDIIVQLFHGCAWTWECIALGRSQASAFLSTQLIEPLLDVARLAFESERSMRLLPVNDLEKDVDRIAKTKGWFKTVFTPKLLTTLRRMTAAVGSVHPAPPIVDKDGKVEDDEGEGEEAPSLEQSASGPSTSRNLLDPTPPAREKPPTPIPSSSPTRRTKPADSGSATEAESDDEPAQTQAPRSASPPSSPPPRSKKRPSSDDAVEGEQDSEPVPPTKKRAKKNAAVAGSSSPLPPPPKATRKKNAKLSPSSESASSPAKIVEDDESSPPPPKRKAEAGGVEPDGPGRKARPTRVRQPLKRGGRRF